MRGYFIGAALVAGLTVTLAGPLSARDGQILAQAATPDPSLPPEDQLAPSQMKQPMPGAVATPGGAPGHAAAQPPKHVATATPTAKPSAAANSHTVACSGPFSKDSSMLKLAMVFDSKNVTFTEVDVSGTKVGASILFPKDPKRRLEIWWSNPSRSDTYLILINGQSTWSAPDGMKLGLTLAEVQKLNKKPFKIKGFDKDNVATVDDWDGGALATIPGGCKFGISLQADSKASADDISALPADKEFSSDDATMRAVKPKVSEILIGY
jgi:hypothetical protein